MTPADPKCRTWALTISNSGDMSQASLTSAPLIVQNAAGFSIQANYTGSPVGTLSVQCSNDEPPVTAGNWVDVSGASVSVSGAGTYMFSVPTPFFRYARLKYVLTSGTGTLSARFATREATE